MRCAALLLALCTTSLSALEVGAQAPTLGPVRWIKGQAELPNQTWTVVEFWATWCAPCRTSIPHLSKLQAQYGDKLIMIGLSDEDPATVRPFVEQMGDKMAYTVGADAQIAHAAYMQGAPGIPYAFLVNPQGTVVWKGHPRSMDDVLASAIAGTFDPARQAQLQERLDALEASYASNDVGAVASAAQALLAIDPWNEQALVTMLKLAQFEENPARFTAVLDTLDVEQGSAEAANNLAWLLITQDDLTWRFLEHCTTLARHAVNKAPEAAHIANTWARVLYALGDLDAAISEQERACSLEPSDEGLNKVLDYYREAKNLRQRLQ